MLTRKGNAVWQGDLMAGKGTVQVGAGRIELPYSFSSRFESGVGSNPEELIAAAHAGCFSMALAGALAKSGHKPEEIRTTAKVRLEKAEQGFRITLIELETVGRVPGISAAVFQEHAEGAKKGCPVSQALAAVKIELKASLAK